MSDAFRFLGLSGNADATQIKRAYVRLLRTHRPDEDPIGFQRLREAYEICLEQARRREQFSAPPRREPPPPDGEAGPVPMATPPVPKPEPAPAHPSEDAFDSAGFASELAVRMQAGDDRSVVAWLQSHEALYSLDRKYSLRPAVVHALASIEPTEAARHLEQVTRFFGLDTVGVDPWLRQQLDLVARRADDAAGFEQRLQRHTSRQADWADRLLARELQEPHRWLRRLFLIAFPGLPGRVGRLARDLRMADPERAEARLDQVACRFWEHAIDRGRLAQERLRLMAIRLALWCIPIGAYAAAVSMGTTPAIPLSAIAKAMGYAYAGTFVAWLAYAVVLAGFIRFGQFNQTRLDWDPMTLMACLGTVIGTVLMLLWPIPGVVAFAITCLLWLGGRAESGNSQVNASAWAMLAAAATSLLLALSVLEAVFGDHLRMRYAVILATCYTIAVLVLHDVAYARRHRIRLDAAHRKTGWLWWLAAANSALIAILLALAPA